MLIAAMDVSGNPNIGNHKHLAIVFATPEKLAQMTKSLGIGDMSTMKFKNTKTRKKLAQMTKSLGIGDMSTMKFKNTKTRKKLSQMIAFDGKDSMAYCVQIDRNKTIQEITRKIKQRYPSINRKKLIVRYNCLLFFHIRDRLSEFATIHNLSLREIPVESDDDCLGLIKDAGLHPTQENHAHRLADIVAWANNHNVEPKGVVPIDISKTLKDDMRRDFVK